MTENNIEEIGRPEDKPKMTDAERLELATKLDRDLDEFIAGLLIKFSSKHIKNVLII